MTTRRLTLFEDSLDHVQISQEPRKLLGSIIGIITVAAPLDVHLASATSSARHLAPTVLATQLTASS